MKTPSPPKAKKSAFTILELLVVIGIIIVLIAIAVPTTNSIRNRGFDARCAKNLRQIALAGLAQSQERNGMLPDMGLYNSHRASEAQYSLLPYLGYELTGNTYNYATVFTCPAAWKHAPTKTPTHRTYAINRYATSSRINQPDDFDKIKDQIYLRLQNIPSPSQMAFFMDGYHRGGGETKTYLVYQTYAGLNPETTHYVHGDAIHVAFLDGHIERLPVADAVRKLSLRTSTTLPFWGSSR